MRVKQKDNYAEAIKYLKGVILLDPYSYMARYHLAVIYKKIGCLNNAKAEGCKFLDIFGHFNHNKDGDK